MTDKTLASLKKEKNAVILAHYYVSGDVQAVADYVGDSFYLAQLATTLPHKTIVMAGVYFMGESVKILNPDKQVHLVDAEADCPMAHMVTVETIEKIRPQEPGVAVVCYINSTAEIKAHSDVCVTSANAAKIVRQLETDTVFFIPDGNLARNVAKEVPEKRIIPNRGHCPVHDQITPGIVKEYREKFPGAYVLAHPECPEETLGEVDFTGSTSGIIAKVGERPESDFIIVTEEGIGWALKRQYPDKNFHFIDGMVCGDMKMVTLEKILTVLESGANEVQVEAAVAEKAVKPLQRMLEMGR